MDRMRLQLLHDAVVLSRGGFAGRSQRSGNETSNNAMVSAGLCNPYVTIRFAFSVAVSYLQKNYLFKFIVLLPPINKTIIMLYD